MLINLLSLKQTVYNFLPVFSGNLPLLSILKAMSMNYDISVNRYITDFATS